MTWTTAKSYCREEGFPTCEDHIAAVEREAMDEMRRHDALPRKIGDRWLFPVDALELGLDAVWSGLVSHWRS